MDSNGNPTTITVLSDEYLDVLAEIREYPTLSTSGTFSLVDKTGAVVSTHNFVGSPYMTVPNALFSKVVSSTFYIYSGEKGDNVTESPSTNIGGANNNVDTYPSSNVIKTVWNIPLTTANGYHQSFRVALDGLLGAIFYKFQISPVIIKTPSQVMAYTTTMTWSRYEG